MRVPSGDQLGKPLFGGPDVSSFISDPSARTMISFPGAASRAPKKPPNPTTNHCPSGDQLGIKAAPLVSWNTRFRLEPSGSMTETDASGFPRGKFRSVIASFLSREKVGKTSVYWYANSGSQLYRGEFCPRLMKSNR